MENQKKIMGNRMVTLIVKGFLGIRSAKKIEVHPGWAS